jgi:hypothetical protein
MEMYDANGQEINNKQIENFNNILRYIEDQNEIRLSVEKDRAAVGYWLLGSCFLLGVILLGYAFFLLYKLKPMSPTRR